VVVRAAGGELGDLGGRYHLLDRCAVADEDADVLVDMVRDVGLALGEAVPADYPRLSCETRGRGMRVGRADVHADLDLSAERKVRATVSASPDPSSADAALRVILAAALPRHGGLLLHASAVAVNGALHVFAGPSGAGKSTLAALLGERPEVERIADELVALRPDGGHWRGYAMPFHHRTEVPAHAHHPLASLSFLRHGESHARTPLPRAEALSRLIPCVLAYASEPDLAGAILDTAARCAAELPDIAVLTFAPRPSVAEVFGIT